MRLQVRLLAEEEQNIDQMILNKQAELKYMVESSETNKYPFDPICHPRSNFLGLFIFP